MRSTIAVLIFGAVIGLSGCASGPTVTPEQIGAADVGPVPGEAEHAAIVAKMELLLKDPQSAEYKWGEPHKDALRTAGRVTFGWEIPVMVNAKNGYGGYTGFEPWAFFLVDGKIVSYQDSQMAKFDFWTPIK